MTLVYCVKIPAANPSEPITMNYPPLSDVRKNLRIKWYRCPIETKRLHELLQRSDRKGWLQAGGHFALWVTTGFVVYWCWSMQWWWWLIAAMAAHGVVSSFFVGVAPHELGHGTVFKTPWLNKVFLYGFSFISWWDPFDYASSHTYHHRYTLHPQGDRENLLPLTPSTEPTFLLQVATVNLLTTKGRTFGKGGLLATLAATFLAARGRTGSTDIASNEWLAALHRDQPAEHKRSVWWSRFLLAAHGTIAVSAIVSGQWILIFIVSLPSFFVNLPAYLVGMTQHCGLSQNDPDFRKCVRSITINPVLEFLYWHMNWHTEHHMFAGVPCYHLPALHRAIQDDMPVQRTLWQAWKEMRHTWRRQQSDPEYFHDTPVPAPRQASHGTRDNSAVSIGDLAPPGLQ